MTVLCLDAGNSRLKWGLHTDGEWQGRGALDYGVLDDLINLLPSKPTSMVGCNVAGDAVRDRIAELAARLGVPLRWLSGSAAACGVINSYDNPTQLGADRWAALIGARALHIGAAIVVMTGTATTIDQLDAEGVFRGGLILPGLDLMRSALARNTADLPFANGHYRTAPRNTDDAIVSGSLHATLGAIERMRAVLNIEATILLSGGAAEQLAEHIKPPVRRIENLVLEGLARYAAECHQPMPGTNRR